MTAENGSTNEGWALATVTQLGLAVVAAAVVGLGGGWLVAFARSRRWTSSVSEQLCVLALALLSYAGAVEIGGNGFVAAFLGGLMFGLATRRSMEDAVEFSETTGLFTSFLVWTIFGALFVGQVLTASLSWTAIAYAALSLTVVRMVPVALALAGLGLRRNTVLFMGWFGPRGLASVVFTLVVLEHLEASGTSGHAIEEVATWTILLSVVLHGFTAGPLVARYGASIARLVDAPELEPVHEPRTRQRDLIAPLATHQPIPSVTDVVA